MVENILVIFPPTARINPLVLQISLDKEFY